jgi:hypothetical protein
VCAGVGEDILSALVLRACRSDVQP